MDLQQRYQEYSFLPVPSEASGKTKSEARVSTIWQDIISRTYEIPFKWHLVVFSPINKAYIKDPDFFKVKGLDKCRAMFKRPQAYIMTREILDCEKVHVNALVCTDQDLSLRNNLIYCNKYFVHVQPLPLFADRDRALSYITKETDKRSFTKYLDYLTYRRQ